MSYLMQIKQRCDVTGDYTDYYVFEEALQRERFREEQAALVQKKSRPWPPQWTDDGNSPAQALFETLKLQPSVFWRSPTELIIDDVIWLQAQPALHADKRFAKSNHEMMSCLLFIHGIWVEQCERQKGRFRELVELLQWSCEKARAGVLFSSAVFENGPECLAHNWDTWSHKRENFTDDELLFQMPVQALQNFYLKMGCIPIKAIPKTETDQTRLVGPHLVLSDDLINSSTFEPLIWVSETCEQYDNLMALCDESQLNYLKKRSSKWTRG